MARAMSNDTASAPTNNSTAVRPGYDQSALGVTVSLSAADDEIVVQFDGNITDSTRVLSLWSQLVGVRSQLNIMLTTNQQQQRKLSLSPIDGEVRAAFGQLAYGECYKVLVYTVTDSGIVSANRSEHMLRTRPPPAVMQLERTTQTQANMTVSLRISGGRLDLCRVDMNITSAATGGTTATQSQTLIDNTTHILFTNLTPFTSYTCTARIECATPPGGAGTDGTCGNSDRTLTAYTFETAEGRPGPVRSVRVVAENPYSASISWLRPAHANGRVIDYLLTVTPWHVQAHNDFALVCYQLLLFLVRSAGSCMEHQC
jgi:hypothetical protein